MQYLRESPSLVASQRVRELREKGREIIDLTVGEPDFDTPDYIKHAAIAAIDSGMTKYTAVNGIPALRKAIMERTLDRTGERYTDAEITIGGGAKQVIFLALMASLNDGDEVIVPTPYWVSYPDMVSVHGGVTVIVECTESDGFLLSARQLRDAVTTRTKWLILNSPSNPTGAVYSRSELEELANVLDEHPNVNILCDEIYDQIAFTDTPVPSLVSVAPRLRERVFVANGVSKTYAMTGWRLGYGIGNSRLVGAINKLQSQSSTCPSSITQVAAAAAMSGDQSFVADWVTLYRRRRDLIFDRISQIDGLSPKLPDGGFYLFIGCGDLQGRQTPQGQTLHDDEDIVLYLLDKASVATIQGSAYGSPHCLRISFAVSEDALLAGAAAIDTAIRALR